MQIKGPLNVKHLLSLLVMALIAYLAADYGLEIFSDGTIQDQNQSQNQHQNQNQPQPQNRSDNSNNSPPVSKPAEPEVTTTTPPVKVVNTGNSLMVIAPYKDEETSAWVFDDARKGLSKEPFVAGIPQMIELLTKDTPNAEKGFRLIFSSKSFPDYDKSLTWTRADEDGTGNYYMLDGTKLEGWLCPALLKYFDQAPQKIFVKAEEKKFKTEVKKPKPGIKDKTEPTKKPEPSKLPKQNSTTKEKVTP